MLNKHCVCDTQLDLHGFLKKHLYFSKDNSANLVKQVHLFLECVFFEEASCQTIFVASKMRAAIYSCRRLRRLDNRSSKAMAVVAKTCVAGELRTKRTCLQNCVLTVAPRRSSVLRVTATAGGSRDDLLMKPLRRMCVFSKRHARSMVTCFFEAQMHFIKALRHFLTKARTVSDTQTHTGFLPERGNCIFSGQHAVFPELR